MRRIWRRFRAALDDTFRPQITLAGVMFAAALALIALAAFVSANNLLFLILAAMMATLLVSGFVGRLGLTGLELDVVAPDHITARRKVRAGVRVRNVKRWVPSFSIHLAGEAESGFDSILYFPVIPGGASLEESVELYFPRRGAYKERNFLVSTRFPFGFAERRAPVLLPREVLVYPCLDPQPAFEDLLASVTGDMQAMHRGRGHDFYRIRPYEVLESARHVDWKASAHTGELQVREFARDVENATVLLLDLEVPAGAEEWFESAVDCCAFIAWSICQRGGRLRLVTQTVDFRLPEEGGIYTILKYLALVSPTRGKIPAAPHDPNEYQIMFSARPERLSAFGWDSAGGPGARVVGRDAFRSDTASGRV